MPGSSVVSLNNDDADVTDDSLSVSSMTAAADDVNECFVTAE